MSELIPRPISPVDCFRQKRIQSSQIKAAVVVNRELLELYWFLGEQILEKQEAAKWGDGFLKQMSNDLGVEFPEMTGFSYPNLRRMRQWRGFWEVDDSIWPQAVAKLEQHWPQLVATIRARTTKSLTPDSRKSAATCGPNSLGA